MRRGMGWSWGRKGGSNVSTRVCWFKEQALVHNFFYKKITVRRIDANILINCCFFTFTQSQLTYCCTVVLIGIKFAHHYILFGKWVMGLGVGVREWMECYLYCNLF